MGTHFLSCPLCGFEFEKLDTLCAHGCPLGRFCSLIRCPSCSYEFLETPRRVPWFKRLFGKPIPSVHEEVGARTLNELGSGDQATVMCVGRDRNARHTTLAVFGIEPGADVTVIQQRPSCVVQVGETQLALDPEIAREVLVR